MNDSTALVTGANKGIGKEIARLLVAEGCTVYVGSRDAGRGQRAVDERPNLARRRFLGRPPESSSAEEFAHIVVSRLRRAADRYPYDPGLARLLAELRAGSEEFTQIWDTDPVHAPGHRTKTLTHPETGALRVNCDVLTVPHDDQQVVFITADPGTPSARALRHLAAVGQGLSAR